MPEGDTVFRLARSLDASLAGRTVTRTDFRVPAIATVNLSGAVIHSVGSRGKHLLMRIGDSVVHSHLKMEGEWRVFRPGEQWRRPEWKARAIVEVPDATAVGFDLGVLEVFPAADEHDRFVHLGPDLLGPNWDPDDAMHRIAAAPDVAIAVALGDQRNLAGLGNVYVNELCFLRGILPTRPAGEVELEPLVRLAARVIRANRNRAVRTTTGDTHRGRELWVYRRDGQPCRRCGTPIRHDRLGRTSVEKRETWWCPNCQR